MAAEGVRDGMLLHRHTSPLPTRRQCAVRHRHPPHPGVPARPAPWWGATAPLGCGAARPLLHSLLAVSQCCIGSAMMSTLLFSIERVAYFLSVIKVNYLKPCKSTSIMKKGGRMATLVKQQGWLLIQQLCILIRQQSWSESSGVEVWVGSLHLNSLRFAGD
ncbi:uncharacterized protein [Miscanthus floridulus]|uniref:uncharacterized protein isoform X2 n=1 Tax=Miscanthus floridulus TaxID=154761 RepID=UPI003458EBB1